MYMHSIIRRMRPLLGTFVEVAIGGHNIDALKAINAAFASITQVHEQLSFQSPASELSRLNATPRRWVRLSSISLRVLKLAHAMMLASDHRFNCTVGGTLIECGALPNHETGRYIPSGDAGDIEIAGNRVKLKRPIRITLDGIAKGFAVDYAIMALKKHGAGFGWVNAGGDMRVFGNYVLPVAQRQLDHLRPLGGLKNASLATSKTGTFDHDAPAQIVFHSFSNTRPAVVSVVARRAWRADALTKVAATTPENKRAECIAKLGGLLIEDTISCVH